MAPNGSNHAGGSASAHGGGSATPSQPTQRGRQHLHPRHARNSGRAQAQVATPPLTPTNGEGSVLNTPVVGDTAPTTQPAVPEEEESAPSQEDALFILALELEDPRTNALTIVPPSVSVHGNGNAAPIPVFTLTIAIDDGNHSESGESTVSESSEATLCFADDEASSSDDENGPIVPNNTPISGSIPSSPYPLVPSHIRDLATMRSPRFGGPPLPAPGSGSGSSASGTASCSNVSQAGSSSASGSASESASGSSESGSISSQNSPSESGHGAAQASFSFDFNFEPISRTFGTPSDAGPSGPWGPSGSSHDTTNTNNSHTNGTGPSASSPNQPTGFSPNNNTTSFAIDAILSPELLRSPPTRQAQNQPANPGAGERPFVSGRFGVVGGPVPPLDDNEDFDPYDHRYEVPRAAEVTPVILPPSAQGTVTAPRQVPPAVGPTKIPVQAPAQLAPVRGVTESPLDIPGLLDCPPTPQDISADILLPTILFPEIPEVPHKLPANPQLIISRMRPNARVPTVPTALPRGIAHANPCARPIVPFASLPPEIREELARIQYRIRRLEEPKAYYDSAWRVSANKTMWPQNDFSPLTPPRQAQVSQPLQKAPVPNQVVPKPPMPNQTKPNVQMPNDAMSKAHLPQRPLPQDPMLQANLPKRPMPQGPMPMPQANLPQRPAPMPEPAIPNRRPMWNPNGTNHQNPALTRLPVSHPPSSNHVPLMRNSQPGNDAHAPIIPDLAALVRRQRVLTVPPAPFPNGRPFPGTNGVASVRYPTNNGNANGNANGIANGNGNANGNANGYTNGHGNAIVRPPLSMPVPRRTAPITAALRNWQRPPMAAPVPARQPVSTATASLPCRGPVRTATVPLPVRPRPPMPPPSLRPWQRRPMIAAPENRASSDNGSTRNFVPGGRDDPATYKGKIICLECCVFFHPEVANRPRRPIDPHSVDIICPRCGDSGYWQPKY